MKQKWHKILTVIIGLQMFAFACNEQFLAPDEELTLSVSDYYATLDENKISAITSSMYGPDWFEYMDKASTCFQELYCGNAYTKDGNYLPFFNGTVNNSFRQIILLWNSQYGIIKKANENINGFDEALKPGTVFSDNVASSESLQQAVEVTIGELKFFRALCYFNLVRWFGAVPLIYDNILQMTDLSSLGPIKEEDIYKFIILDLNEAVDKLPENRNTKQANRLTLVSSKALLAKVYLTRAGEDFAESHDFLQAATLADEVINNGAGYRLMDEYHENFLPKYNNSNFPEECLWGWSWTWVSLSSGWGSQNTLQSYFASNHFTQSWDGWSAVLPSVDYINSFEPNDVRRYSTIMENKNYYPEFWTEHTFPGQEKPGYVYYDGGVSSGNPSYTAAHIRKHLAGRNNSADGHIGPQRTEVYTPIIRLSDLYLTYAEAILAKNENTSDGTALKYFNKIRERAGLPAIKEITYFDIWNERRHEFAFEFQNGDDLFRYYNLYPEKAKEVLLQQKRGYYNSQKVPVIIEGVPAEYPEGNPLYQITSKEYIDYKLPTIDDSYFKLPYPITEINGNINWNQPPGNFDFNNYK